MPNFAYTARDLRGERVTGSLSAGSEREAISLLSAKALFPIEVTQDEPQRTFRWTRRVGGHQMATAYGQLAALLRSGVPLLRSLKILQEQSSNPHLQKVLDDVHSRVEDGATLAEAMERHPAAFGELGINMVRAGGEGGFLEDALDRVALFTEQQEDLKSRTMGALAYPAFLGVIGAVVVAGLLIFFVPNFAEIFDSLREAGELPVLTDWLLATSEFLQTWWLIILLVLGIAYAYLRAYVATDRGREQADLVRLRFPVVGAIYKNLAVARFCRVLGTLIRNGVPILKSLEISREACGNRVLSAAVGRASENISSGEALAAPLAQSGHFPRPVVEMIAVAEEANTLDTVLVNIADDLERRTERRLELAVRMLEPVMLLVLAVIILMVVIALLLPVLKMSSTI
jgi:general secretion pathway protein F/type IV pilus assembly protein PilC